MREKRRWVSEGSDIGGKLEEGGRRGEGHTEERDRERVRSICENEICAFDLQAGVAVGSIRAMKK